LLAPSKCLGSTAIFSLRDELSLSDIEHISSYIYKYITDDTAIDDTITTISRHGLISLVYHTLRDLSTDINIPPTLLSKLQAKYKLIAQKNMLLSAELIKILNLLNKHNIKAIPFKGPTLAQLAYGDITFNGYKTPSIFEVDGAKDVAVESFTLSKSYNMAGWRVGFFVGNKKLIGALIKIKSWLDYGMFTPIQVAATVALNSDQECVKEITQKYYNREQVLIESFKRAGWDINPNNATMFCWAKIPDIGLNSLEFSKKLMSEANVAVAPGIGFGEYGEGYVRIALIENEKRIRQAAKNIKQFLKQFK